jgi:hypothetical protein
VILIFVGLKMVWLNGLFGGKFPIGWSLGIIATILALSILVSIGYARTRGTQNNPPPPPLDTRPRVTAKLTANPH